MLRRLNKRGDEADLLTSVILIMVAAIVIIFAYFLNSQIMTAFSSQGIPTLGLESTRMALETFNLSIIFITISFGMAAFIGAFIVRSHPIFFMSSVLGLIMMLIVTATMSNVFDKIMVTSVMSETATTTFSKMFIWIRNMPEVLVVLWVVLAIGMYAKWSQNV